jgi:aspartate kinase
MTAVIPNLTVEKIGGTSMSKFGEVISNVILRSGEGIAPYGRIFIVSAYGGVTNSLLEHKKTKQPGVYSLFETQGDYASALDQVEEQLIEINEGFAQNQLDVCEANNFIRERILSARKYLKNIAEVMSSGYVSRHELLMAARELLASIGESHSAYNSALMLKQRGYQAITIDLSGWDDHRELSIDQRIKEAFINVDPSQLITFVTGYCKGIEGIMREFDRGYSEVTFSKVAVLLNPKEAIIHKEFHLSSGDPIIIGKQFVRPVCATNFDVADQLADVGMEAIHPKASKPLELADIPIRVKNAFDPDHEGTLISKEYVNPESRVEIIAGSNKVVSISIHDTRMVGAVGFDLRIMEVLAKFGISYLCKATNANTIEIIVMEREVSSELIAALAEQFEQVTSAPVALVCAIGSNIAKPGILARAAAGLAESKINILAISQTSRQTNIQFVVERAQFEGAERALHSVLCTH